MSSIFTGSKLSYFPIPGRGESVRLALAMAGAEFMDNRVPFKEWATLKPSTPWGSMPILLLADGTQLSQQRSLLRFIGRMSGLYPEDPMAACHCDEVMDVLDDLQNSLNAVGRGMEQKEKGEARAAAAAADGPIGLLLGKIDAFAAAHGTGGHVVGGSMTVADIMIATVVANACSGFFDGVPADTIKLYPNIQAVRKTVMTDPAVVAWYAKRGDEVSPSEKFIRDVALL